MNLDDRACIATILNVQRPDRNALNLYHLKLSVWAMSEILSVFLYSVNFIIISGFNVFSIQKVYQSKWLGLITFNRLNYFVTKWHGWLTYSMMRGTIR